MSRHMIKAVLREFAAIFAFALLFLAGSHGAKFELSPVRTGDWSLVSAAHADGPPDLPHEGIAALSGATRGGVSRR